MTTLKEGRRREARLDAVFSTLSDPTRRQMIERLAGNPMSVTELAEPFPISLPGISKHLKVLERAGLVARIKKGRTHRVRLVGAPMKDAARWLERHRRFWEERLDALSAFLEPRAKGTTKR